LIASRRDTNFGIDSDDIWNFDETGFQIGVGIYNHQAAAEALFGTSSRTENQQLL
jgi:hypothetical protein